MNLHTWGLLAGAVTILVGCATPTSTAKYARIDEWSPPVYVITDEEIDALPDTLTIAEMLRRFGRPIRCEIDVGIYPRFQAGADYSEIVPFADDGSVSYFIFWPDLKNRENIGIIVANEPPDGRIVWPRSKAGMSWTEYHGLPPSQPRRAENADPVKLLQAPAQ